MYDDTDKALRRIKESEVHLDAVRGCLIGGAVGDALGYAVEFLDEDAIFARYGRGGITGYELDRATGKALISDDTQMTLFTSAGLLFYDTRGRMRGIAAGPNAYIEPAYQAWLLTQEDSYERVQGCRRDWLGADDAWLLDVPELFNRRAPGGTCLSALRVRRDEGPVPDYIANPVNVSKGCGGVMRVAPVALALHWNKVETIDREAAQVAAITHGHPLGYMPAAVLVHIVHRLVFSEAPAPLEGVVLEARDAAASIFAGDPHLGELLDVVDRAVLYAGNGEPDLANIHRLGEGWVGEEALGIALYCALRHQDDFSAGVITAVNHRGDSDSTGAITGNILGARLGYGAIDARWKADLELADVILETADDLCHGCQMDEWGTYRDPAWWSKYGMCRRYAPDGAV